MKGMRWLVSELSWEQTFDTGQDAERIGSDVQEAMGVRSVNEISLSQMDRMIWEGCDFAVHGSKLYRRDDITVNPDNTDWGSDIADDCDNALTKFSEDPKLRGFIMTHMEELYPVVAEDAMNFAEQLPPWGLEDNDSGDDGFDVDEDHACALMHAIKNDPRTYTTPREKYTRVYQEKSNTAKKASEDRKFRFAQTLGEIKLLGSSSQIVDTGLGVLEDTDRFLDRLRDMYREDKQLRQAWAPQEWEWARGNYAQTLVRKGWSFGEIEIELYRKFDRVPQTIWAISGQNSAGEWYVRKSIYKPSAESQRVFNQTVVPWGTTRQCYYEYCRMIDYQQLNFTVGQWGEIYSRAAEKMRETLEQKAPLARTQQERLRVRTFCNRYRRMIGEEMADKILKSMPTEIVRSDVAKRIQKSQKRILDVCSVLDKHQAGKRWRMEHSEGVTTVNQGQSKTFWGSLVASGAIPSKAVTWVIQDGNFVGLRLDTGRGQGMTFDLRNGKDRMRLHEVQSALEKKFSPATAK